MEFEGFELDRSRIFYQVEAWNGSNKTLKSRTSMLSEYTIVIRHSLMKELYVGAGDGAFYPADEKQIPIALSTIIVDSPLFALNDESVHRRVHQALSAVGVNRNMWEEISNSVMEEGARLVSDNLKVYQNWKSKSKGRVNDTIMVNVVNHEIYLCYEGVGES